MALLTAITLRAGEASPTDIKLYPLPVADAPASLDIYLCGLPQGEPAGAIGITLRAGEASPTDIRLHPQTWQGPTQDTDIVLRAPGPCGTVSRNLLLGAVEGQDAASFAITITGGGALIDLALAAVEGQDTASLALVRGHPFALNVTEAADVAAFALTVDAAGEAARGTIIGGFGPYPQPSATPEWLGALGKREARKVERIARKVRAGALERAEADEVLAGAIAAGDALRAAQAALDALLRYEADRIAELIRDEAFRRAMQEEQAQLMLARRNENALRVLMLMTLH